MTVVLHGYQYSVYLRIVRLALAEKGVAYERVEVDPFAADVPASYLAMHPFKRVPVLVHDDFVLYETGAITRYVDETFPGPRLQPTAPRDRARMTQIISVIDSYAYWPMVRQIYSHAVFRPLVGERVDPAEIVRGLEGSTRALGALEALAAGGDFLVGATLSLADLHLGPMMAYFSIAPEGKQLLSEYPRLSAWWHAMQGRPSLAATDPGLPGAPNGD
ncbi:MAG TPA: glutathione S-transferase family protein [Stellaceae bacterium]|nr:glutathione S-transferase family protein [Stellaceae bacterium]